MGLLNLWVYYEQGHFTRPENEMRRGVRIERISLSEKTRLFLAALPSTTFSFDRYFIYKKDNEVLLAEKRPFRWSFWKSTGSDWPCIAYVNLNVLESHIEFRVSLAYLISLIVMPIFMSCPLVWFFTIISAYGFRISTILWLFVLTTLLVIFVSSVLFNYRRKRNRLLTVLNHAVEDAEATSLSQ